MVMSCQFSIKYDFNAFFHIMPNNTFIIQVIQAILIFFIYYSMFILALLTFIPAFFSQKLFYEHQSRGSCLDKDPLQNPQVDWNHNFLCNGDFQDPRVPGEWKYYEWIPCWKANGLIELGWGKIYEPSMKSQVLELDAKKENKSYKQKFKLEIEGKYELKFDYAPRRKIPLEESSFTVYFNGHQVTKVRPSEYGVVTALFTIYGRKGKNTIEFEDNGRGKQSYGAVIDNVGIYGWKSNENCIKETEAVGAGYPVTYSSFYRLENKISYQLDSSSGWCPSSFSEPNCWIQVASINLRLWNSITIQGSEFQSGIVTKFKLGYTQDGVQWLDYDNGASLSGVFSTSQKIRYQLQAFYAVAVRIIVVEYRNSPCLRFGATYLNPN